MYLYYTKLSSVAVLCFALGFALAAWCLQPVTTPDQAAILREYLGVYCRAKPPIDDDRRIFMAGMGAAMSRITIVTGLGEIALAQYVKCKIGLQ